MIPDFSQPGSDGEPLGFEASGFKEWHWGVTYTVRPEMLGPLRPGRDYRFMTIYRRKVAPGEDFSNYGDLYRLASATADARIAEMTCPNSHRIHTPHRIHTWIAAQSWFRHQAGTHDLAGASITM